MPLLITIAYIIILIMQLRSALESKIVPKARLSGEVPFGRWRKSFKEKRDRRKAIDENDNDEHLKEIKSKV